MSINNGPIRVWETFRRPYTPDSGFYNDGSSRHIQLQEADFCGFYPWLRLWMVTSSTSAFKTDCTPALKAKLQSFGHCGASFLVAGGLKGSFAWGVGGDGMDFEVWM